MDRFKFSKESVIRIALLSTIFIGVIMDMPFLTIIGGIFFVVKSIFKGINGVALRKGLSICMVLLVLVTATVGCTSSSGADDKTDISTTEKSEEESKKPLEDKVEKPKEESKDSQEDLFSGYKKIEVDGGNLSGHREPNVVVDIGFGDREYYAFTNEHAQLVKVVAKKIVLQDDSKEPVTSSGRYYKDEAKVPGTERKDLDEGHIIADSLGGVSNAYNITPQDSTLNRHGDQAYMEKVIRDAGGCTDFVAIITYPDTKTQIPSKYSYTYTLKGKVIKDEFDNANPEKDNNKGNAGNTSSNTGSNDKGNTGANSTPKPTTSNVVFWTPSGKSYHTTKGCSTLSRSKTILEGTQQESGKSDPCDRCH